MNRPKMIIFDAGRTLLDYESIDTMKGVRAIMPYLTSNPHRLSAEQINDRTNDIFSTFDESRRQLFEVPELTVLKLVYDMLQLKFSISLAAVEEIIWNSDSEKVPVKNAAQLITYLQSTDIETAVISNLDFSGHLLRKTLEKLFPENRFRFVIASSDYGIRKPHRHIFEAGIQKSGLPPEDIWYVGDKISVDVLGSQSVGMVPILYKCPKNQYTEIPTDLIVIADFLDLIALIEHTST